MSLNIQIDSTNQVLMSNYDPYEQTTTLKKFTSTDIDDFMEWATDDEVTKFMMWNSYTSRRDGEEFFRNVVENHPWFKAVCLGNKVIGSVTLDQGKGVHSCKAELGYVISRKYWSNGFATQAINLAVQKGFEDLNVERIEAFVDPANIASQRVLEKNGFAKEGLLKNYILHKGILKDRFIYAILKS